MAAIPYLWYWIVGGLVAVLIATVAIFSERTTPDFAGNKTILSEKEAASGAGLDETVTDQQNDTKGRSTRLTLVSSRVTSRQ